MRYDENDRESKNIDDRRGQRDGGFRFPGSGGPGVRIPVGGKGGMSLTTLLIIGAIMLLFGINPLEVLLGGGGQGNFPDITRMPDQTQQAPRRTAERNPFEIPGLPGSRETKQETPGAPKAQDEMRTFIARVLADTEDVWNDVFKSAGRQYQEPQLVMFTGATRTACGTGQSAMGPFYCPLDQKVYIDLGFFNELERRFNAPGDFAQAYVIAHEVGHHVQTLLGISEQVQRTKQRVSRTEGNRIQVMMELQADCLAGVWANLNHQLNNRLEDGDIEEGLNAAKQIGDDMIQKRQQGYVVPDSFTHGSSAQRKEWFTRGFKSGEMKSCDTFNADSL
ncbi:metalloprotease [Hyphomicrobium nitrativorans NL23]|uniref:Metalloprotease n=1 Tax=Hyphomicrobium nitrativorans NL23 TaxID=1029756 RepID=V5SF75_9HYPH|nr:neutral zinc metallopeptidase [Hyphomicrobium nitrativorans]AHB48695.1 metalloprotease [Hyphomicrobium nitrativorans NL23]